MLLRWLCYHVEVTLARWTRVRDLLIPTVIVVFSVLANAAPTVEIKAKTQLSLSRVKLRESGYVEVTGLLVDKLTNDGIPGQTVTVTINGASESPTTQPDGSFHAMIPADPGQIEVVLGYPGGHLLDRADPLKITTDPAKQQVELSIAKVADDPAGAKVRVTASGEDGIISLDLELAVAPQNSDTFHTLPGHAVTNEPFLLARNDTGGPGMFRLRATFAGDGRSQRASKEVLIELASSTTTTMTLESTKVAYEDNLKITGSVTDDDHHPVAGAAVTLTSGDRRLAQGTTADNGTYKFSVEGEILGAGTTTLQVQADPGRSYVKPSRSDPQDVKVSTPQPVPVSYTVAAFVATGLAAAAFFLARKKPWQRLRRQAPPAEVASEQGEVEVGAGGLVVAKPGIVSTLRRAADDGFSGVVRDTVRGRPIGEAVVRLLYGDTEREVRTSADGNFAIEKLGIGEWQAEVAALGHVTERFAVTIPHRGELRGVRVDLVPVREKVFQLYRRAAEPVLPEARLWGIWSPRQIVDHVRTKRPTPALAELTDFVEEIYFSPRPAAEAMLQQASERVDKAIHERARAGR